MKGFGVATKFTCLFTTQLSTANQITEFRARLLFTVPEVANYTATANKIAITLNREIVIRHDEM